MGLSEMRGGLTMFQKVCLKMTTTNFCGTLLCKQTMKLEDEKIEKYQDLAREVRRMWGVKSKVIPVVVGALGG